MNMQEQHTRAQIGDGDLAGPSESSVGSNTTAVTGSSVGDGGRAEFYRSGGRARMDSSGEPLEPTIQELAWIRESNQGLARIRQDDLARRTAVS
jgi:hypothetical protein